MFFSKYKKYVAIVLVVFASLVTGLTVGKIYVDNLESESIVSALEKDIREENSTIEKWVQEAKKNNDPTKFTAVQLYNIAEYQLFNADQYYKLMTGTVNAPAGIKQKMRSEKLHVGGEDGTLVFNKLSPSTSSLAPSICSQMIYDYSTQGIKINSNGVFDSTSTEIKGIFDKTQFVDYTMDSYKEIFNTEPTKTMPYIISSKTCAQNKVSGIVNNGDGTYSFKIAIDGDYLALAGLNYAYEIKFSSGMKDPPKWVSLEMDIVIDQNFNFVSIDYVEQYKMNAPVIGMATVKDEFFEIFKFKDIPTLEEVTG